MRTMLFIFLISYPVFGVAEDESYPPSGQQIIQVLFENINAPLKHHPFCRISEVNTLAEYIARNIGDSTRMWESESDPVWRSILTRCDPELQGGVPLPGNAGEGIEIPCWRCVVTFREHAKDMPLIGQTSITLFIKADMSGLVPNSIQCLD